jgi:hypothetical protein
MDSSEVPDLQEERLRRAFKRWLQEDEEGRTILDELRHDPVKGRKALRERLERDAPELSTRLGGSSSVGKLVNVASEVASLHIHEAESGAEKRPLVRLFLQPLSSKISVGSVDPCLVRALVANEDSVEHEIELKVTDWLSQVSEIRGGERFILPSGGHKDVEVAVTIAPERAVKLPARMYNLEVQAVVVDEGRRSVWATEFVALTVLPFQWIDSMVEPAEQTYNQWRRHHWASYQLVAHNRGNSDATITVGRRPGLSRVEVELVEKSLSLAPDGKQHVPVRARPMRRNLLAERKHMFRLFTAASPQHEKEVTAILHEVPPISKKQRKKLLLWTWLIAAILLGFVVIPLRSEPGSGTSGADQLTAPTLPGEQPTVGPSPSGQPALTTGATGTSADKLIMVVRRFYEAVNARNYRAAWDLLDDRKLRISSFEAFQAGYAKTDHVELRIQGVRGSTVDVELVADEGGGRRRSIYKAWYRVQNGRIVAGRQRPVRPESP